MRLEFEYMSYYLLLKLGVPASLPSKCLNICRITFWSNSDEQIDMIIEFEYMSYYLLVKLEGT